jgi:hypothetical protein
MADKNTANSLKEKFRQALENLGKAIDEWLVRQRLKPQLAPIPIDSPHRRRK